MRAGVLLGALVAWTGYLLGYYGWVTTQGNWALNTPITIVDLALPSHQQGAAAAVIQLPNRKVNQITDTPGVNGNPPAPGTATPGPGSPGIRRTGPQPARPWYTPTPPKGK